MSQRTSYSAVHLKGVEMDFTEGFLGGLATWPALIVLIEMCALFACMELERGVLALVSVAATITILDYVFHVGVVSFTFANMFTVGIYFLAYVAFGVLFSLFRWDRYCAKWRREYDETEYENGKTRLRKELPRAKTSKSRIITWMMFWPWSLVWWVIRDFVKEIFIVLYEKLGKVFDRIAHRHTHDLVDPQPAKESAAGAEA